MKNKKILKIVLTGILTLSITSNFNYANAYNIKVVDVLPSSEDVKLEIIESSSKIIEVKVRAKKDVQNVVLRLELSPGKYTVYEYKQLKTGEVTSFEIDIEKELSKKLLPDTAIIKKKEFFNAKLNNREIKGTLTYEVEDFSVENIDNTVSKKQEITKQIDNTRNDSTETKPIDNTESNSVETKPIDNTENNSVETQPTDNPQEDNKNLVVDGSVLNVKVLNNDKGLENSKARLFRMDGNIPNVVANLTTDENGYIKVENLIPNSEYEIRMLNRNVKFDKDAVRFTTDPTGKIHTINGEVITDFSTPIAFKSYEKTSTELQTAKVTFKVLDKDSGNFVSGVEFTANIINPLSSYKNATSDNNGDVTFDLEGAEGGKQYTVCVSKNAQFNYEFEPAEITLTVDEAGKVTFNENTEAIFKVKAVDKTNLKVELENKIKEAEQLIKQSKQSQLVDELQIIVEKAKEELSKETIPGYVEGFISQLIEKIEKVNEANKPVVKFANIPTILVNNNGQPVVLESITFDIYEKDTTNKVKTVFSENGMLSDIQLDSSKEYTLKISDNNNYSADPINFKFKEEYGEFVPVKIENEEIIFEISVDKDDTLKLSDEQKSKLSELFNKDNNFYKKYSNLTDEANAKYWGRNKPIKENHTFTKEDMLMLEKMAVTEDNVDIFKYGKNITELTVDIPLTEKILDDIKKLTKLKALHILENKSTEVTNVDVSNLTELEDLRISHTKISNIVLPNSQILKTLVLRNSEISNLQFLENQINLEELELSNNKISNIDVLSNLTKLHRLYLDSNPISNISSLSTLSKLEALVIKNTNVTDISLLNNIPLYRLVIENLPIKPTFEDINSIGKGNNEYGTLNTIYLEEITLEDFNKYKNFVIRDVNLIDAKYSDNVPREITFKKLVIEKTINRADIENGVVQIDNPLKNWNDEYIVECDCNESKNANLAFENDKILINVQNINSNVIEENYSINEQNYDFMFGEYGQPASISSAYEIGNVTIKLTIVD